MGRKKTIASTFDSIRADYDMSRESRFIRRRTGVAPMGAGADYHYRTESKYYADIEQARDMDRNDALLGSIVDRRVDNVVQSGFTLDPKTGDKGLDLEIYTRWNEFANDPELCDVSGEMTFPEMVRFACRAVSVDGDIVIAGTETGAFQVIEAHSIQVKGKTENTFLGVTSDQYKKRTHYWVMEDVGTHGMKAEPRALPVRDELGRRQVFHVYDPKRCFQTRGVTQLAPVFFLSGMLEDINFAKLVQQQSVSCWSILRSPSFGGPTGVPSYGDSSTETTQSGVRYIEDVQPGMEITANPGEKIEGFSPNIPNSEYFDQVRLVTQIIGVAFGLPLCLVMMDGSETNFSGWRGAVDEARKGFVADQVNLVRRLSKPAFEWWLSQQSDLAKRPNAFAHNWNLPTWSYIEPVADAQGDAEQLRNALTSPRRLHAARGKDWEEVSEEIIDDNLYAIRQAMTKAEELNKEFPNGAPINWRDLISLPMPAGMTMSMQDPNAVQSSPQITAVEGEALPPGETKLAGLNGAQVSSLAAIIEQVTTGVMPKETAKAMINAAFPDLGDVRVDAILGPIKEGESAGEALEKKSAEAADALPGDDVKPEPVKAKRKPRKTKE